MPQTITLAAEPRKETGKGAARKARAQAKVPGVIYGHGRAPQALEVGAKALEKALTGVEPEATIIELELEGKRVKTLIREIQRHPLRPDIIHVDFYEVKAGEKIRLKVPVRLVGVPDGVRNAGGVLDHVMHELEIETLPEHIPDGVEVDVTALVIGHSIHVRDVQVANATILSEPDQTVCTVVPPRAEEVAPVVEAPTEVAEPELIRKPREEDELAEGETPAEGPAAEKADKPEKAEKKEKKEKEK
jgi:large subunit ribosomal protein L25